MAFNYNHVWIYDNRQYVVDSFLSYPPVGGIYPQNHIGKWSSTDIGGHVHPTLFNGTIAELRIYGTQLSNAQVFF